MTTLSRRGALMLPLGLAAFATACAQPDPALQMPADPSGLADSEMRALLETFARTGARPFEALTVAQARSQPSFAEAVRRRALEMSNTNPQRVIGSMEDITLSTVPVPLQARLYRPIPAHNRPLPIILFFHGGGWVLPGIESYDATARALCIEAEALVISVAYRLAPENPFPAAHDDANVAYLWAVRNAASVNGDASRIVVAGESAGGNLALNIPIYARSVNAPLPRAVVAIYPVGGTNMMTPSYQRFANAKPLGKGGMEWFVRNVVPNPAQLQDPRLDLIGRANFAGMPPVIMVNAEIDPLASDGTLLADKLRAAGVTVSHQVYPGVTHEFFGADAVLTRSKEAQGFVGSELRRVLGTTAPVNAQPAPRRRRGA